MMYVNFGYIAILKIKGSGYCCIISGISKFEARKLLQNINNTKKSGTFQKLSINNSF